jgi:2-methylisocitrate lyase-like PEP mutase family enzyme
MNIKKRDLRNRIEQGEFICAPGVFDLISARIADRLEFPALYMTGYGVVASSLGLPDAGLAGYSDMVERVDRIASATSTPVIADGDTGYGGLLNVDHTVRGYERAGACAIQLEDQASPKKCGHTPDRKVIPVEDMVSKIKVALTARESEDFLVIARTDSRTGLGIEEAIRRGQAFADAGADIIFVESPESVEEMAEIGRRIEKPLLANIVVGGSTPLLSKDELSDMGYQLAIFPGSAFLAMGAAVESVYTHIKSTGSTADLETPLYDFQAVNQLMGFDKVWKFEETWHSQD